MADDPIDAFDKLADDIRRAEDELAAADALRAEKAAAKRTERKAGAPAGDAEPPEPQ